MVIQGTDHIDSGNGPAIPTEFSFNDRNKAFPIFIEK